MFQRVPQSYFFMQGTNMIYLFRTGTGVVPLIWTLASCPENNHLIEGIWLGLNRGQLGLSQGDLGGLFQDHHKYLNNWQLGSNPRP